MKFLRSLLLLVVAALALVAALASDDCAAQADGGPILYVGVRELPEYFSPATAWTEGETQAIELLFESLIRPEIEPAVGQRYYPRLARELPKLVPLGRDFHIAAAAKWSNGTRVSAVDVRRTVELLRAAGRAPLIDEARVGGDPYHITLALEKTFFDPLALMDFKVLPASARLERLDDETFARKPIGSGPYVFAGRVKEKDRVLVRFTASKHYRWPDGHPGFAEIRFYKPKDSAADFARGRLHLLLDPAPGLKKQAGVSVLRLPARRAYFLAVNQRKDYLRGVELRRCLGLAFDRAEIVKEAFGAGKFNRPLNGPFLAGSWASDPKLKPLFDAEVARVLAEKGKIALGGNTLTLKYPEGDPRVRRACELIRDKIKEVTGIELKLTPRAPRALRDDVINRHDYDLAYFHHDFVNEASIAWPLFNPRGVGKGGSNFLGVDERDIVDRYREASEHQKFADVQAEMHAVHAVVHQRLPLIPLWQLELPIALHDSVRTFPEPARLDRLRLFLHVGKWKISSNR